MTDSPIDLTLHCITDASIILLDIPKLEISKLFHLKSTINSIKIKELKADDYPQDMTDPKTYREALEARDARWWKMAMEDEMIQLDQMRTFDYKREHELPDHANVIDAK